jgi:hypothetical protein
MKLFESFQCFFLGQRPIAIVVEEIEQIAELLIEILFIYVIQSKFAKQWVLCATLWTHVSQMASKERIFGL